MKEQTIWEELKGCINSIRSKIREEEPDQVSIDYLLWKVERRMNTLSNREKA